jgi:L-iditol 2-dehydrogenase
MSIKTNALMSAVRLHGKRDLRIEQVPHPGRPGAGEVLVRIAAVGICGSDVHTYVDGQIGDTRVESPVILGHEFAGVVEEIGPECLDGEHRPLQVGALVAVDPAQPCGHCQHCERGNPNFCEDLKFCGLWPDDGALCQYMRVPARTCFPLPPDTDPAIGPMLETLGIAIHTIDLSRIRVGSRVAVIGAGPVGLCVAQLAKTAGAEVYITDPLPWRAELALKLGMRDLKTHGADIKSVDVAIECANASPAQQQAADLVRPGGLLVAVGIPSDDRFVLRHSTVRRKGLTIISVRRMKLTYPRAIRLWKNGQVDLASLTSHRFPLAGAPEAFRMNAAYEKAVVKVIVEP